MATTRSVEYEHGLATFEGVLAGSEPMSTPAPTVLVCHGMEGRSEALFDLVVPRLLSWGYQAFMVDLYGKDTIGSTPEDLASLMQWFFDDRAMLAARLSAVVTAVAELPEVDPSRMAAIGFCFGGLCVLDMARTGLPLTGVASFHGVLQPPPARPTQSISSKIAVYHGWDDPFAPSEDVAALASELTAANADWQLQAFGHTCHAFTAPQANNPEAGIQYNARSAERAWTGLHGFLADCMPPSS